MQQPIDSLAPELEPALGPELGPGRSGASLARSPGDRHVGTTRLERLVFLVGGSLIGLNILVDSLVVGRPGAVRSDHVLAAVVPLAILVAITLLYPRMRPGLRASAALLFGLLALVWGGVAAAVTVQEGLTAGRASGLVLILVGVALISIAVHVLWRARGHDRRRYLRAVLYALVGLLALYWIVLPLGLAAYATHRPRVWAAAVEEMPDYEEVVLNTDDGLALRAWYIPSTNGAAVITLPRETSVPHAVMLARHGYGVLMVDMRGYGDSEGDPNAFGWGSGPDVDAAVAYLASRAEVDEGRIGGLGLSVGGEQMIEAAASNDALKAVVSEGAGERSVAESLIRGPRGWFAMPSMAVQTLAVAVLSGDAPPRSLGDLAGEVSPGAVFFIHAEHGGGGEELNLDYFQAAGEPKDLWRVEGSDHLGGLKTRPQEYERRVIGFFDTWLLGR